MVRVIIWAAVTAQPPRLFEDWFSRDAPFTDYPDLACLEELDGGRELIEPALRAAVIRSLIGVDLLSRMLDSQPALSAAVERIPKSKRQMSGDFGEILATEYVDQCTDFRVPLRRLRFKADREFPMQGDDIVALSSDGSARLLKGESKSRVVLRRSTVRRADKALNSHSGRPKPETVGFLSMRLRELGQDDLAERVEAFMDGCSDEQLEHLLFSVSGNDGRELLKGHGSSARPAIRRHIASVMISDHAEFISDLFAKVREEISGRTS